MRQDFGRDWEEHVITTIFRIFVTLLGMGALWGVAQHWFLLDWVAAERGVTAVGAIGRANVRADIGGLFLAIGLFALIAAWRRSAAMAGMTAMLIGCAMLGRICSAAIDGIDRATAEPLIVELICLAIVLAAWRLWRKNDPANAGQDQG